MKNELLKCALGYLRRGWSVIPVRLNKRTAVKWRRYQEARPSEENLREWFTTRKDITGLAVILGKVSSGLCCADFDDPKLYERFRSEHPELAAKLPTSKTGRGNGGFHVFFKSIDPVKTRKHVNGLPFDLLGEGSYAVLPPSLHKSGATYQWIIPPGEEIPFCEAEFFSSLLSASDSGELKQTAFEHSVLSDTSETSVSLSEKPCTLSLCLKDIEGIIKIAVPKEKNRNHDHLFILARSVKTFEKKIDGIIRLDDLKRIFDAWYSAAAAYLRPGQGKDEYWFEFQDALDHVKYPLGSGPVEAAVEAAKINPLPAVAQKYDSAEIQLLIAVCHELQALAGDKAFYLSNRMAAGILGVNKDRAGQMLRGLEREKILHVVARGGPKTNKATRFRYLPDVESTTGDVSEQSLEGKRENDKTT